MESRSFFTDGGKYPVFVKKSVIRNEVEREWKKPVSSITNIDIQGVINRMSQEGRATSSMRESLGRMRECMESAKNNQIISLNPCFEINVPWENTQVRRRFLSREEQNTFLGATEHNWYKEIIPFFLRRKKCSRARRTRLLH